MEKYTPKPVDTSEIVLPDSLQDLSEEIAKNVHEIWAMNRLKDGWKYGTTRDDTKKEHPCLIAYEDLPESEKDFDRATSQETLKLIIKLGFKITR